MSWTKEKLQQYNCQVEQALLYDEQTLVFFSQDFGRILHSQPAALFTPRSTKSLQSLLSFAYHQQLPVTIRGNGLSQSGQSLTPNGGLIISMQSFNKPLELLSDSIWVEANTSWSDVLAQALAHNMAPYVVPYNCNLSIAGVLSAGGFGSSSFKYGAINAHIQGLEVIDGMGNKHSVGQESSLFQACMSGQGQFGVITKAQIKLKKVHSYVKTFSLVYTDPKQWFADLNCLKKRADYLELFCSPSVQGARLEENNRVPYAQWLYALHYSLTYTEKEPTTEHALHDLKPWSVIHCQTETIASYLLRHNSRFDAMKLLGQWDLFHPWYECFIPTALLQNNLTKFLDKLPLFYANLVHIVPVAKIHTDFLMLGEDQDISSIMILNPGVPYPLKDACLKVIAELDAWLIAKGGKRYLSGFLGYNVSQEYWVHHFGKHYNDWNKLKQQYDPAGIFQSLLFASCVQKPQA